MTIEEALREPQPLIAVWDESRRQDAWLGVYALPPGQAPTLLAHEEVAATERSTRTDALRAQGVRVGTTARGPAIWAIDDTFDIWSDSGANVSASREVVRVAGRAISASDVASVTTFVDGSRCHRGVRLDLRDGTNVLVAEEHDPTPELDPTYGWDMLTIDAFWASLMGNRLAQWLGVRHINEI